MRYIPTLTVLGALALAACGSDKAEAPAPGNTTVVVVPPDEGNVVEPVTPARAKICERQPWKCPDEQ